MKFETRVIHSGPGPDPHFGDVAPAIHLSTTFARDGAGEPVGGHAYIRESNPNQVMLEEALAPLEGGQAALAFASGMAASVTLLQALPAGSHVIIPHDGYIGLRHAAHDFLSRWGLEITEVDMGDLARLGAALRPNTRLVGMETPSNPLLNVIDLAGALEIARKHGARTMVDNTFATPALQRPIELGADVVLHSTTKYLGGHSDVQGGALVFARKDELFEKTAHARHVLGPVASPFNSWLILRGIRTLACRVAAQGATAMAVARALEARPAVSAVHYPGLESHPGHALARRQMSGFGAMMSFRVRAGREAAIRAVSRARLFIRATSLGGVESLIEHRQTSEGPGSPAPPELIRLSIGLEHADDLIDDLTEALAP
jgi:cystathionine gamma-synthase